MIFPYAELCSVEKPKVVEICWSLKVEVSCRLIMHIGADPPCSFSLKCFESHVVKFQLDGMEPWSQLASQKKVQENLLGTVRYFEEGVA